MGLARVHADGKTFLKTGSVAGLSDWPLSDGGVGVRERARYACPEDVYEHDHDRLVQALTIVAGSRDTAADAVQEAFVRLVRDWGRVAAYEDPAAWVRRVALNLIQDHRRAIWSQARLLLRIEQQPSVPEEIRPFDPQLWRQVTILPAKQRTAVALRYVGDLTLREVAEAMRVSEGTVDQHLRRALRTLRETLEGQS
jgi:RNA polymerase sigma-70 factor, ECF subfamily